MTPTDDDITLQRDILKIMMRRAIELLELQHSQCHVSHHAKKDRHPLGVACPIERRVEQLRNQFYDFIAAD